MAKAKIMDSAKQLESQAKDLFERIKKVQADMSSTLSQVRRTEATLSEKEENVRREREEQEKRERLRELLASDADLAVHVGDHERELIFEADSTPKTVASAPAAAAEPVKQSEQELPSPAGQRSEQSGTAEVRPEMPKAEASQEAPKRARAKTESPAAETEKKAQEVTAEPASAVPEQPKHEPDQRPQQESAQPQLQQGGYQQRLPQQGGYQQRLPQQGGYQQRPPQQGGYQQRPPQQGGYQQRPPQEGGYQQRPPQEGGYQQRPPQQGGYQQRPPQQGGYQQRPPQQGGYQQRPPQQGGYQQRPPQQGGYQQRPPQEGGYQQRPPQQGGYQQRPPQQGGYQQRPPQQGGYQQRPPQQGGYQQRPPQQGGYQQRPQGGAPRAAVVPPVAAGKEKVSNYDPNKNAYVRNYEAEKKAKSKKAVLKETVSAARAWGEESTEGIRRRKSKRPMAPQHRPEPIKIEKAVITTETITVKDLSEKIGKPAAEIIKKLFILGTMATINQELDFDTCSLIAGEYGIELEQQIAKTYEEVLNESSDEPDESEGLVERPPVVTIMGHVDHGKTSLLDAIRHSNVTEGEAGGITQHIGAYTVMCNKRSITFIDTPGHEAFTSMRARGAQVTDIVILVVAADDGIMPQTIEAINHSKAAGVPIIVAVNKIDRPEADPERVKQQLTEHGLVSEEWGGETICVPVSAKTKQGVDTLLEMILLQADVLELKANPNRIAKGTIIEAELHKGRGPIATVLVQNGTLKIGDTIVAGTAYGRVRAMMDDKGRRVTEAGPSMPVEVLGFSEVPSAGDVLNVAEIDKLSRQVAEERKDKIKAEQLKNLSKVSLDDLFHKIAEGQIKDLNIIVKADVQGSVEAVKQALEKLSNEEVRVRCIHGGVGAITGSDVMFASASNAIIIGFNVRPDSTARAAAEREKVDMRLYRIIYNAIEDVQNAMKGMFAPVYKDVDLGRVSVREIFKVSGVGTIAGAYVLDGKVNRHAQVRVVRDGIVIHDGKIASLKRFKDDVKEVAAGYECGIGIENFNDLREGDVIEAYVTEEVKR
ncbi:MAG: translation initiation factor IF-2 [Bacillota bacterium]